MRALINVRTEQKTFFTVPSREPAVINPNCTAHSFLVKLHRTIFPIAPQAAAKTKEKQIQQTPNICILLLTEHPKSKRADNSVKLRLGLQ